MTCAYYMGPSCGLDCCMARAEQFALFIKNEPSFAEFCPMVQRYGELVKTVQGKKAKDQGIHAHRVEWGSSEGAINEHSGQKSANALSEAKWSNQTEH